MNGVLRARSADLETTLALAGALAPLLRRGDALCLDGELGAGKTTFVAALARELGVRQDVVSPTFTLENRYRADPAAHPAGIAEIVHCDLYRPGEDARRDLLPSMLEAREEGALLAVEWGDPVKHWLEPYLSITVRMDRGPDGADTRVLTLRDVPEGWPGRGELARRWREIAPCAEVDA